LEVLTGVAEYAKIVSILDVVHSEIVEVNSIMRKIGREIRNKQIKEDRRDWIALRNANIRLKMIGKEVARFNEVSSGSKDKLQDSAKAGGNSSN